MKWKKIKEIIIFSLIRLSALFIVIALGIMLFYIFSGGIGKISWEFLSSFPTNGMKSGGIFPMIIGTLSLMILTMLIALPIGILSAIYLVEYTKPGRFTDIIRLAVHNLAGVPSIVYGLLGLGLFVLFLGFGLSLISAAFTLAIMVLPIVITASQETLYAVPKSMREGALALGSTKWETTRHHVLPYAIPGMLTGSILALSRAAGETAPIIMTGAAFYMTHLPSSVFDEFMALPYSIYTLSTESSDVQATRPVVFGAIIVLLLIVLGMNLIAISLRNYYRKKYRW
ncbi:MAG: phosphate ABC transporter permease PstA [Thermoplasmatales archaeon]|nr:MAG: phosphate ABC transporter permease PstA [Thermoplasmatales archaeon]